MLLMKLILPLVFFLLLFRFLPFSFYYFPKHRRWKNNVERKAKFKILQDDAMYRGHEVKKAQRALWCQVLVALIEIVRSFSGSSAIARNVNITRIRGTAEEKSIEAQIKLESQMRKKFIVDQHASEKHETAHAIAETQGFDSSCRQFVMTEEKPKNETADAKKRGIDVINQRIWENGQHSKHIWDERAYSQHEAESVIAQGQGLNQVCPQFMMRSIEERGLNGKKAKGYVLGVTQGIEQTPECTGVKNLTRHSKFVTTNPFPVILFDIVTNEDPSIIGWNSNGTQFKIRNFRKFIYNVLSTHFSHSNFSRFQRLLCEYGFKHATEPDQASYYHPQFLRDARMLAFQVLYILQLLKQLILSSPTNDQY